MAQLHPRHEDTTSVGRPLSMVIRQEETSRVAKWATCQGNPIGTQAENYDWKIHGVLKVDKKKCMSCNPLDVF